MRNSAVRRIYVAALGTLIIGPVVPSRITAQDSASAWSRLVYAPNCPPTDECPWRPGLLWDTTNVMPRYPEVMKVVGIAGHVMVAFAVDTTGRVNPQSIRIERSTNKAFEPQTFASVKQWRFTFSQAPNRPTTSIPMRFRMTFAIVEGCYGRPDQRAWGARGAEPELIVLACAPKLVPRDQIRPMNGPG